jgi:cytochrome bd-type quinol oxidase subunit 2
MSDTQDADQTDTVGESGELDPREAADLLEQTTRQARRRFNPRPPLLSVLGATVILVVCGAVWLSVRGQHPYKGPTAAALVFLYGVLIVWVVVASTIAKRASAGVSGHSVRQQRGEVAAVVTALIAVSVFQGALKNDGVSHAIVYGIYPLTAQLIVLCAIAVTAAAAREDWPLLGVAITVMVVAAGSAFAGPRGVWLSDGVGCCVAVLGYAAAKAWLLHTSRSAA